MSKKRIFVVEDAEELNLVISRILQDANYDITSFYTAEGCLKELNRGKPDLLILDIMLPGMDGLKLYDEIKSDKVPIIFLSGVTDLEKVKQATDSEAFFYLLKPIDPYDLLKKVEFVLKMVRVYDTYDDN